MGFKCIFVEHDVETSCICARCGKMVKGHFGKNYPPIDVIENHFFLEGLGVFDIEKELRRHTWDGCKCVNCGIEHAWVRIENRTVREIARYRDREETYICLMCRELKYRRVEDTLKLGW